MVDEGDIVCIVEPADSSGEEGARIDEGADDTQPNEGVNTILGEVVFLEQEPDDDGRSVDPQLQTPIHLDFQ